METDNRMDLPVGIVNVCISGLEDGKGMMKYRKEDATFLYIQESPDCSFIISHEVCPEDLLTMLSCKCELEIVAEAVLQDIDKDKMFWNEWIPQDSILTVEQHTKLLDEATRKLRHILTMKKINTSR